MHRSFSLPWSNFDIDVHPDPPGFWRHVVVVGGWQDKKRIRARWPHAAVVGPLRSVEGVDLLARALLANPQIRVVAWDGPDLSGNPKDPSSGPVSEAFGALWGAGADVDGWPMLSADLRASCADHVTAAGAPLDQLVATTAPIILSGFSDDEREQLLASFYTRLIERLEARGSQPSPLFFPPPVPEPIDRAPHGDAGDRVAGATLAEVYPRLLARVNGCGREVPTQYGPTRELMATTVVVRDPVRSLNQLPLTDDLTRILHAPGNVRHDPASCPVCIEQVRLPAGAEKHPVLGMSWEDLHAYSPQLLGVEILEGQKYSYGSRLAGFGDRSEADPHPLPAAIDQFHELNLRLPTDPLDRALFLSPWRPDTDLRQPAGGEPCLVGAWFRATPLYVLGDRRTHTLHLVTLWRSRDLWGAWRKNAAAACQWLVQTAQHHEMKVGTYTDISLSLHLYERDWFKAKELCESDAGRPPPGVAWDPRTIWHVQAVVDGTWQAACDLWRAGLASDPGPPPEVTLRATAHAVETRDGQGNVAPGQGAVVAVIEANHPDTLCRRIAAMGLVQEPSALLWLGGEIARVWDEVHR